MTATAGNVSSAWIVDAFIRASFAWFALPMSSHRLGSRPVEPEQIRDEWMEDSGVVYTEPPVGGGVPRPR